MEEANDWLRKNPKQAAEAADIMVKMAKLFAEKDASLIEINPLIADGAGKRSVVRRTGRSMQHRVWDIPLSALTGSGLPNAFSNASTTFRKI